MNIFLDSYFFRVYFIIFEYLNLTPPDNYFLDTFFNNPTILSPTTEQ